MADIVTKAVRSRMMSGIRGKNTKPELVVRSFLHREGFRFRLHARDLPGRPDLVLPKYRAAIQVRGCYWHQHRGCRLAYMPASNADFWRAKLTGNTERDARNDRALRRLGWRVLTVWECEVRDRSGLQRIARAIRNTR
jgi:DNA mismatch endonuclease, patch repair protein